MDLAVLQKFLPLFSLLGRPAGELTDTDLQTVSSALSKDDPQTARELFDLIKANEPAVLVKNLLGSKTVKSLVASAKAKTQEVNSTIFCKCPVCDTSFETDLK